MVSNADRQRLRAGTFVSNNGKVLRTINILRYRYNKLSGVQNVLEVDGVDEDEFLDSINFLSQEGYIHLQSISTRDDAKLADYRHTELEAMLTSKGIRLLARGIEDNLVEV